MGKELSSIITERIVERLENAIAENKPFYWVKPWDGGPNVICAYETSKNYNGINRLLLDYGEYTTFNKLQDYNKKNKTSYHIKKGEKSNMVVFFDYITLKDENGNPIIDEKTGEEQKKGYLKYYNVFDRRQIVDKDGEVLPSKFEIKKYDHTEIEQMNKDALDKFYKMVEAYCKEYKIKLDYVPEGNRAYYDPSTEEIKVPAKQGFESIYEFVKTVSHELSHSTGHILNRSLGKTFGSKEYAREEIVADIAAEIMVQKLGITDDRKHKDNDIAYLTGWAKHLKNKTGEIIVAAQQAEKAVALIESVYEKIKMFDDIKQETPEIKEEPKQEIKPETIAFTALNVAYEVVVQGTALSIAINGETALNLKFGTHEAAIESANNFKENILENEKDLSTPNFDEEER